MTSDFPHKQRTTARLLSAWAKCPELRLGQLIHNATHDALYGSDMYHLSDDRLAQLCEEYTRDRECAP